MEIDEIITVKEKILIILDSRNATAYYNDSWNSKLDFDFQDNLNFFDSSIIEVYCSVLSFTCPNSIYIINENNNYLALNIGNFYFPYGNYNAQTFMTTFLNVLPLGFNITFNSITNAFTISYNSPFIILNSSTINEIMGFSKNTDYVSINNSLTMPFTCNFNGLQNINVIMDDITTKNMDSYSGTISSILQNIPVDCNSPIIKFVKTNDFCIPVKINSINQFSISLMNDSGQYINLNNQHFSITIEFTILKDIPRFKMNFQNIIKNV